MSVPQFEITLTEQDRENATAALCEPKDQEEKRRVISEIQKWLNETSSFKGRNDEKIVTRFLRSCKYRPDCTKGKLTNYFKLRVQEDRWFENRDPTDPNVLELLQSGTVLPLHGHDKEKKTVILIRTAAYNPKKYSFLDLFKIAHMIMDMLMELDETVSVYGLHAILDLSGNTVAHVLQLTPKVISKAVHAWQNCYPVRTRRIDFFNAPIYANVVIKIFLKFMNEKLKSRVHVFGSNQADLHNVVDPVILPKEYGGTAGTVQELTDFWMNRLAENRDFLLADQQALVDNKE